MATYLQGVTDYVPQVQPFQPDLNFYKGVMDTKESQYKAGYDKISNMYGQLLNSELTRGVNNERRSTFFKQITNEIQRLSGVDLSLQENVETAYSVFQPLINDKNIIKDMAWTKNYNKEMGKSEQFRNCTDEKACGGKWWEGGVRALQYQKMDFSKTTDEQALQSANAQYTPYVNVTKMATQLAKDMGFNVQTVDWSPDGKYIVTTKGGQQMTIPLANYFSSVYGNDPNVQAFYKTQAYLDRKDTIMSTASQYGSEDAAENAYLTEKINLIESSEKQRLQQTQDELDALNLKKGIIDKTKTKVDVDINTGIPLEGVYQSLQEETNVTQTVLDQTNNTLGLVDKSVLVGSDLQTMRWRVDQAMASNLLNNDLINVANSYSMLNMEQKIEADPYAKASFENSLAIGRMGIQHQYNMQMVEYKAAMGLVEDSYGVGGKKGKGGKISKQELYRGNTMQNILNATTEPWGDNNMQTWKPSKILGGSSGEKGDVYKAEYEDTQKAIMSANTVSADYLQDSYNWFANIIRTKPGTDEAKLAAKTISDIVGKDNLKYAMNKGIIDKNYNIVNNYEFAGFVNTNRDRLMNSTSKAVTDNSAYFFADSQVGIDKFTKLANQKLAYDQFAPIAIAEENRMKKYVDNAKNTFLSKSYSETHKSDSWINKAGRWLEDNGMFIPILAVNPLYWQAKGVSEIKDRITGEQSHLVDYVSNQYKDQFQGPSQKNKELFINQMFEKDGYNFKSKADFVRDTMKNYKQNTNPLQQGIDTFGNEALWSRGLENIIPGGIGAIRNTVDALQIKDSEIVNHLEDVYDTMVKDFKAEYSSGSVGNSQRTHVTGVPMETLVDGADFTSPSFQSYHSIMENYLNNQDTPGVKVLFGSGHTDTEFKDKRQDNKAADLIQHLYTDMMNVSYDYDDAKRPMIKLIGQSVAANDPNMTAYTFQINEDYMSANTGTDKKPGTYSKYFNKGQLKENNNIVTMYIPKDVADNDYINYATKGPYQKVYEETGVASLNLKNGIDMTISKQGNVGYLNGAYKIFNPNTGTFDEIQMEDQGTIPVTDMADIDNIFNETEYMYYNTPMPELGNMSIHQYNLSSQWNYNISKRKT